MQPPATRLWLVEDNIHNALVVELLLRDLPYPIDYRHLHNGREMREALQAAQPDILLMDLELPGEDGLSLGEWIRSHPEWHEIKIVAITANYDSETVEETRSAGFSGFILKPLRREMFSAQLEQIRLGADCWPFS
jgi:CheY-like chemotaxis protein